MTKKDYVVFARMLKEMRKDEGGEYDDYQDYINYFARELVRVFEEDNPRFDADKFLAASQTKEAKNV